MCIPNLYYIEDYFLYFPSENAALQSIVNIIFILIVRYEKLRVFAVKYTTSVVAGILSMYAHIIIYTYIIIIYMTAARLMFNGQ